ncbi:MAG: hypothetical protein HGA36_00410 [Candidatus Moranbacteria bacterium]|nr:hypothetical protein [Candidatus Moranbacteria bacterium]
MKLQIQSQPRGDSFCIKNLKDGNKLTSTMKSGELVVNDVSVPFVLQRVSYGRVNEMLEKFSTDIGIIIHDQLRSTLFTKNGYISIQLTNRMGMIWVYIKKEFLKEFFSAICMASL